MVVFKILNFFSDLDHFNAFWWAGWVCALCSGSTSLFESNGHVMSLFFDLLSLPHSWSV